nr:MAG TPA: hypothetical protein [Crassvirales sp.]
MHNYRLFFFNPFLPCFIYNFRYIYSWIFFYLLY